MPIRKSFDESARSTRAFDVFLNCTMKGLLPLNILSVTMLAIGNSYAQSLPKSTAAEIPIVDYCELTRNPLLYDQKSHPREDNLCAQRIRQFKIL
jgi:hypothetical protein